MPHHLKYDSSLRLATERLVLRPTKPSDVERALENRSVEAVARNLIIATLPPDRLSMMTWFSGHRGEWDDGNAYRFAVIRQNRFIGVCDVFDIIDREGEIGYWLDHTVWGQGFGFEAANQLVRFAFDSAGLRSLRAGCADDNAASAAILTRLGFERRADVRVYSRSRREEIVQRRFYLGV